MSVRIMKYNVTEPIPNNVPNLLSTFPISDFGSQM